MAQEQWLCRRSYAWEFNLVKSAEVNAFCMPGGKIVVYEGILPVVGDETSLAVVVGHEVAHAVAKHANERMSQQMLAQGGTSILDAATKNEMVKQGAGVALQYGVLLPYSRKHETEADELGLIFMAMAGYNPQVAPAFWERMSQLGGSNVPEFMNTHPSSTTRTQNLQKFMPKAMEYYKSAGSPTTTKSAKPAKTSTEWSF